MVLKGKEEKEENTGLDYIGKQKEFQERIKILLWDSDYSTIFMKF